MKFFLTRFICQFYVWYHHQQMYVSQMKEKSQNYSNMRRYIYVKQTDSYMLNKLITFWTENSLLSFSIMFWTENSLLSYTYMLNKLNHIC